MIILFKGTNYYFLIVLTWQSWLCVCFFCLFYWKSRSDLPNEKYDWGFKLKGKGATNITVDWFLLRLQLLVVKEGWWLWALILFNLFRCWRVGCLLLLSVHLMKAFFKFLFCQMSLDWLFFYGIILKKKKLFNQFDSRVFFEQFFYLRRIK